MKIQNEVLNEIDLSGFHFFQSLTVDELKSLNAEKTSTNYKKGSVIYKEGNKLTGFYCLILGIVKIYKTGFDGKEQIIRFAKKGDIIAYRSLLSQESACTTAKTIEARLYATFLTAPCLGLFTITPGFRLPCSGLFVLNLRAPTSILPTLPRKQYAND